MGFKNILNGTDDFTEINGYEFKSITEAINCKDGATLSVQASRTHYCTPRTDDGPYTHVEVGYPSVRPSNEWEQYFDGVWQKTGFIGSIERMWADRSSIQYSIKQGLQEKSWWYFSILVTLQDNATSGVYGYVPVELVQEFIDKHGGEENNES